MKDFALKIPSSRGLCIIAKRLACIRLRHDWWRGNVECPLECRVLDGGIYIWC
jgi:hypothetical protein